MDSNELLAPGHTLVMGVVNVTPDSFSDGGRWLEPEIAVAHGQHLVCQGADILDIGGESTRPGAQRVDVAEELRRVVPVVEALASQGFTVSVDTMRAEVAQKSLRAGAQIINDVSGGKADEAMARVIADAGCPYVIAHWRAPSAHMSAAAQYTDVVSQVRGELLDQVKVMQERGVSASKIIIDPNLGFSKNGSANWEIIAKLQAFTELGYPVLVGASRKRFLGELLEQYGAVADPLSRDHMTAAISALVASMGAWGVRVHDVAPTVDAMRVVRAVAKISADSDEKGTNE